MKRANRLLPIRSTAVAVMVTASAVLGASGSDVASAANSATKPQSVAVASYFSATANAATGSIRTTSVSPGAVVHPFMAATNRGHDCIVQTKRGRKLVRYQPRTLFSEGNSYEDDWLFSPYSIKHARVLKGKDTFQVEMCITGLGETWNSYHQWFNGGAIVLLYTKPHKLRQRWGTKVIKGSSIATLSFQLSKGAVTIRGSAQVKNYGTHAGDTGRDPNLQVPKTWRKFDVNRVDAFYMSSNDFIYQGTPSAEGNVGLALFEFVTGGTVNFNYGGVAEIQAFCAKPMPLPCKKFF
jgi:hypothetical protein